ncbi:hypothetical protein KQH41_00065 [bacterium]|nr:hypothetical protein [bacterium]
MNRFIFLSIIVIALVVISKQTSWSNANFPLPIDIDENGYISATFENVSLDSFIDFIEKKYNISFLIESNISNNIINVTFNKIAIEKAIKRILSDLNYVFIYDKNESIIEIHLLSDKLSSTKWNNIREQENNIEPKDSNFSIKRHHDLSNLEVTKPSDSDNNQQSDIITNFKVIKDAPAPGE